MKRTFYLLLFLSLSCGCGMVQQVIKSSFPYTTTLNIPTTVMPGVQASAVSLATSFDQNFKRDGNNASRINTVRIVGAKMQATNPSDYNIGNIASMKIYMSKPDGSDEILVASRSDIGANAGNNITLDIDNSHFLDEHVRQPNVRVRMVYKLRKAIDLDVNLKIVLSLTADAGK